MQRELIELLPRLRRFARALTRNAADADDLVQLTLERALRRADQFRAGHRLDNWVYGIMKNAWIDELRAGRRRTALLEPEERGLDVGDATTTRPVEAIAIREAFGQLPPDQRVAVALVLIEGLSYREAAEVAEVPEGTLTSRVARGRAALLAQLSDDGGTNDY